MSKTVAIVQARIGSTRLPGKVLKEVLGKPLIHYLAERVGRCQLVDQVVYAIPDSAENDVLEDFLQQEGRTVYRGDEKDVLNRFCRAAAEAKADTVVRLTADNPLIDPAVIDQGIAHFYALECHYLSNTVERTFPRGMDVEVFTRALLDRTGLKAESSYDREHVTPYMLQQEGGGMDQFRYLYDASEYRLTVDTQEDFDLIASIFSALHPKDSHFSLESILNLLREKPELVKMNQEIEQRK